MGLYSNKSMTIGNSPATAIEAAMNFVDVDFIDVAYEHVSTVQFNYNNILETIGINELAYFEEHGTEIVYEAADKNKFVAIIERTITNILQKLKELFERAKKALSALFDGTAQKVKLTRKTAEANFDKISEFNFPEMNLIDPDAFQKVSDNLSSMLNSIASSRDYTETPTISTITDGTFNVSSIAELGETIHKSLYSETKRAPNKHDVAGMGGIKHIADVLASSSSKLRELVELRKKHEKLITDLKKRIEQSTKALSQNDDANMTEIKNRLTAVTLVGQIVLAADGHIIQGYKDYIKQYSAIYNTVVLRREAKSKNESTIIDDNDGDFIHYTESGTSFLDGIVFN